MAIEQHYSMVKGHEPAVASPKSLASSRGVSKSMGLPTSALAPD
jgi:hypothetical protein